MVERTSLKLLPIVPFVLVAIAIVASWLAVPHLPERIPTHWGFDGRPTNLAPRGFAVWALPLVMLWLAFILRIVTWSVGGTKDGRDLPVWLSPAITSLTLAVVLLIHLGLLGVGLGWGISSRR
jgi:uncharacterized membrane protein